jgi:quinol-cytochrome oxidoreductase complex cytochrome b subunit
MEYTFTLVRSQEFPEVNRHLVDGTVKSVLLMQVFGLLSVRFRKVSLYRLLTLHIMLQTKTKQTNKQTNKQTKQEQIVNPS